MFINKDISIDIMVWREQFSLEKIKPLKKTIGSAIIWAFVLIIGYVSSSAFYASDGSASFPNINFSVFFGAWLVVVLLTYLYQVFYMNFYFYDLADKTLIIRKGVFSRNEIALPIKRLQDVYVDQDILDRIFGLYDVHVSSATMISGWLSHIDGVNKENADKIKNLLLKAIHK